MEFKEFLDIFKRQNNLQTSSDLYEFLGGNKALLISDRQLRTICAGEQVPSPILIEALYEKVSGPDKKTLLIAYIKALFERKGGSRTTSEIISYLDQNLLPPIERITKSLWNNDTPYMLYTDEQLDYLNSNRMALQLHNKLLLLGELPVTDFRSYRIEQENLEKLELIEVKNNKLVPSRMKFRLPHVSNSGSRLVSKASDLITNVLHLYLSKEGNPKQELGYGIQMVEGECLEFCVTG